MRSVSYPIHLSLDDVWQDIEILRPRTMRLF